MKKTIIAGAASLALAAMPMAGVFAETVTEGAGNFTDSLSLNIEKSCTFTRGTIAHTNGSNSATWTEGSAPTDTETAGYAGRADSISLGTVTTGAVYSMGSSTFHVTCNVQGGYEVKLVATPLHDSDHTGTGADIAYAANAATATASTWSVSSGDNTGTFYENNGIVKTETTANTPDGADFTVYYNVGLKSGQAAGTYTGSATYTLTQPATN